MLLSIIIPTYNRGNLALERVNELLPYLSEDVDLWVLNNGSNMFTDEYNKLSEVSNEYFHYIDNGVNIGVNANFKKGYAICDGKFGLFASDEDMVLGDSLNYYVQELKNNTDIAFMKGSGELYYKLSENKEAAPGIEAIRLTYQKNNYLSGSIYNRSILTPDVIKIYDDAYSEDNLAYYYYNHMFWTDYCAIKGRCKVSNIVLIHETEGNQEAEANNRILTDDVYVSNLAYSSYSSRIRQFFGFIDEISDLGLENEIKVFMVLTLIAKYATLLSGLRVEYEKRNMKFEDIIGQMKADMRNSILESSIDLTDKDLANIDLQLEAAASIM